MAHSLLNKNLSKHIYFFILLPLNILRTGDIRLIIRYFYEKLVFLPVLRLLVLANLTVFCQSYIWRVMKFNYFASVSTVSLRISALILLMPFLFAVLWLHDQLFFIIIYGSFSLFCLSVGLSWSKGFGYIMVTSSIIFRIVSSRLYVSACHFFYFLAYVKNVISFPELFYFYLESVSTHFSNYFTGMFVFYGFCLVFLFLSHIVHNLLPLTFLHFPILRQFNAFMLDTGNFSF